MKTTVRHLLLFLSALLLCAACVDEDQFADNPKGNFEALWKIMDEHYCFFQEKGIDWDSIHTVYARQINSQMTDEQLLEVLGNMLATLKDGHVNLFASFDYTRYWGFHENYPSNYSDTLVSRYLGTDYRIASGMKYRILDDQIGYLRCATFENNIGSGNLDDILLYLAPCRGLIIDLRDNGLTNRQVYSAANEFVKYMRCCPRVTVVGDRTGGGAGLPFSSELPNGWSVRFSSCPMYDRNGQSTENGMDPDVSVSLTTKDFYRNRDTIIEAARRLLATAASSSSAKSFPSSSRTRWK